MKQLIEVIITYCQALTPRDTQGRWTPGSGSDPILTLVGVARPLIKLKDCEHREDAVGAGGSRQLQTHTHTHTHTHAHSVPRDTHGRRSIGKGSDAILTHVGVARQ